MRDWEKKYPSHVHRTQRYLALSRECQWRWTRMPANDGAGAVAYDLPRSFKALSLSSMRSLEECRLADMQTYSMQPFRFTPPISRKIQKDYSGLTAIWGEKCYHSPHWPDTLVHTSSTAGFGCQSRRSERAAVTRDVGGGREEERPGVIWCRNEK